MSIEYPLVSIIITTCNRFDIVTRAINSSLNQTYKNIEVIVVDDMSEDKTLEVIDEYISKNEKIRLFTNSDRLGLASCRNKGVENAKGTFVVFLDDDDELKDDSVEKRIKRYWELKDSGVENIGVVYSGAEVHFTDSQKVSFNLPKVEGDIFESIRDKGLSTIPSSCLFNKKVIVDIGGYDQSLVSSIDHDLWMKLAVNGYNIYSVNEPLSIIYETKNKKSMVANTEQRIQGVNQFLNKWYEDLVNVMDERYASIWCNEYRAKVLGFLCANNIYNLRLKEALKVFRSVYSESKGILEEIYFLYRVLRSVIGKIFVT